MILLLAAVACSATLAAAQEDYQAAMQAYNRGDVVAAMAALRAPARAGHAPSQAMLAFILDRADFAEESLALYRAAAAQDNAQGHAGLANHYLTGRGVAKDEKLAFQHFSKAADLGDALAIEQVADAHLRGLFGLAQADPASAVAAVRRAAELGHLPSIDALAQAHDSGRWGVAVEPAQAAQWRARGAELRARRVAKPPAAKASA